LIQLSCASFKIEILIRQTLDYFLQSYIYKHHRSKVISVTLQEVVESAVTLLLQRFEHFDFSTHPVS